MITFEQALSKAKFIAEDVDMYIEQDNAWLFRDPSRGSGASGSPFFAILKSDGRVCNYMTYAIEFYDSDTSPLDKKPIKI